jgi:hypothetical protein
MRKVRESHYPQLSEVRLEEFDVRLLPQAEPEEEEGKGAESVVRVLGIFSDGKERWGTVGVAEDILQASVECIISGGSTSTDRRRSYAAIFLPAKARRGRAAASFSGMAKLMVCFKTLNQRP